MRRCPRCAAAARPGAAAAARRARRDRRFHAAALLLGGQRDDGAGDAGDGLDHALGGGAQRLQLLGARGRNGDREEHLGVGDEDVGDHAEADDVALEVRPAHGLQAFDDGFLGDGHRRALLRFCVLAPHSADRRRHQARDRGSTRAIASRGYFARIGCSASVQRDSSSSIVLAAPINNSFGVKMPSSPMN